MDTQNPSSAPVPAPAPSLSYQPKEPAIKVRVLWKWSLLALVGLVVWGAWQCGSALRMGSQMAEPAVAQFHQELNAGQYSAICDQAAEGFCKSGPNGGAGRLFENVHNKLGDMTGTKQGAWNVNTTTNGTFVTIQYDTTFASGQALETFTWIKTGNALKLYRYNIQSDALLN